MERKKRVLFSAIFKNCFHKVSHRIPLYWLFTHYGFYLIIRLCYIYNVELLFGTDMLSKLSTVAFNGVEATEVSVEVQISAGIPNFVIVGLADKSIAESKERIRASFSHLSFGLPARRIVVNLAPADLKKEGAHYDLPIALGILSALDILDKDQLQKFIILGSLSLDALVAPVVGVLPAALFASSQGRGLICPAANKNEALWAGTQLPLLAPVDLLSLVNHFKGVEMMTLSHPALPTQLNKSVTNEARQTYGDMKDVRGQFVLKRAFEIAAAGRHNLLMIGPPGSGKSMMAQRMMGILPPPSPQEMIETTMIYSLAGQLHEEGLVMQRPFRAPHHSASLVSLVGGGFRAKPGEISLAHNGVLFLDELPEFSRASLEALRQPLESNVITISRANEHITYPAKIQLLAAMNPCRCGYFGVSGKECARAPRCAIDYQNRLSGPLLDRFDLTLFVPPVSVEDLLEPVKVPLEDSATLAARVTQAQTFHKTLDPESDLQKNLLPETRSCLCTFAEEHRLSARSCTRLLRVSRTIADFEGEMSIRAHHIKEAIQYRYVLMRS